MYTSINYSEVRKQERAPSLPTNIIRAKIAWLKSSGKSPMGLGIPPLKIKIMLELNPLKSIMLVGRLTVRAPSAR